MKTAVLLLENVVNSYQIADIKETHLKITCIYEFHIYIFVGPLQRVRPRNGILALGLVVLVVVLVPLRSEFIGEL